MMFAQMQHQAIPRNLAIKRSLQVEPMVPIDREPEEPKIELVRLGNVEYAQYRNNRIEADLHDASSSRAKTGSALRSHPTSQQYIRGALPIPTRRRALPIRTRRRALSIPTRHRALPTPTRHRALATPTTLVSRHSKLPPPHFATPPNHPPRRSRRATSTQTSDSARSRPPRQRFTPAPPPAKLLVPSNRQKPLRNRQGNVRNHACTIRALFRP